VSEQLKPGEVVPAGPRDYLRWDHRHDAAAKDVMREYGLTQPHDRELIRQLAQTRVIAGQPDWQ
jgi:hypothetical protein